MSDKGKRERIFKDICLLVFGLFFKIEKDYWERL